MNPQEMLRLDRQAVAMVENFPYMRFGVKTTADSPGRPFVAILGPRGVGKTIFLRQMRKKSAHGLYISADTLPRHGSLKDIVRLFGERYAVTDFFIDEIHFISDYAADLKELYDFTGYNIWFSSSVALSLHSSSWDLSRRVRTVKLLPFSFREFLFFRHSMELPRLSIEDALLHSIDPAYLRQEPFFEEYLKGGLYPFLLEAGTALEQFANIASKIINDDIPHADKKTSTEDILEIEKILQFIGRSPVDGINYSSVSKNVGISKYKAEKFLTLLEKGFVIKRVFPEGTNVLKEPKVLMELPYRLLYKSFSECIGELREDFFAAALQQHGLSFSYAKTTRGQKTPDYLINLQGKTAVVEIGGKGKGRTQFKGVDYDTKIMLYHSIGEDGYSRRPVPGSSVPLHCISFG
ncbi:MAG: ATP-binding protein [Spirochaetia bacterium]